MKTEILNYPRLTDQPAYKLEADKLAKFRGELQIAQDELNRIQLGRLRAEHKPSPTGSELIKSAESMIGGQAVQNTNDRESHLNRLIPTLEKAIQSQSAVVRECMRVLSKEAGTQLGDQHRKLTKQVIAAATELCEANKAESSFRSGVEALGYEGALPPTSYGMGLPSPPPDLLDPYCVYSKKWLTEVSNYVLTAAEREARVQLEEERLRREKAVRLARPVA